ncbi:MAG: carbohydrate porin, partial [Verrucomicrobiota bacterium]
CAHWFFDRRLRADRLYNAWRKIPVFFLIGMITPAFALDSSKDSTVPGPDPAAGFLTQLNHRGITFPFTYTGEVFGNLSGGYKQGAVYDGLVKVGIQLDLEKLSGWKGGSFLVNGLYPHGGSITNLYVHDFNGVSNIDAYDSPRLYELWFQQNFENDKISIRLGQLAADSEFCISNGCCLFINGAFGEIPLMSKNIDGPVYPIAAPGVRIRIAPNDSFFAQFSTFIGNSGDQASNNRYGTRFFNGSTGALLMGEIGYALNPPPKTDDIQKNEAKSQVASGRPLSGNYKLGGYYDTATFDNLRGNSSHRGEYAFYLIADQEVWQEPGDPDQGLRLFTRAGASPSDRSTVSFYCDGGVNYQGLIPCRDKDLCGIGVSYTKISNDLLDDSGSPVESHHETIIEASYQAVVTNWLSVQPDFQYIFNPGATGRQQNAVVAGLRFTVNF